MIEFMSLFPARCKDVAQARGVPFERVLDTCYPGAGAFWVRIRDAERELTAAQAPS
jgi:hypothetical protein